MHLLASLRRVQSHDSAGLSVDMDGPGVTCVLKGLP